MRADAFSQQPVSNLPGKHSRVLPLVRGDGIHYGGCGDLGLAASDNPSLEATRFVVPGNGFIRNKNVVEISYKFTNIIVEFLVLKITQLLLNSINFFTDYRQIVL